MVKGKEFYFVLQDHWVRSSLKPAALLGSNPADAQDVNAGVRIYNASQSQGCFGNNGHNVMCDQYI